MKKEAKIKPFLKWAGGKGQLIEKIERFYPFDNKINKYAEPFIGGGAVLFDILNKFELEKIRPKLIMDGGNIEFINYKDGILKIRFLGECAHCELSHITLKFAIEKTIKEKIPEVNKVIEVKMSVV